MEEIYPAANTILRGRKSGYGGTVVRLVGSITVFRCFLQKQNTRHVCDPISRKIE